MRNSKETKKLLASLFHREGTVTQTGIQLSPQSPKGVEVTFVNGKKKVVLQSFTDPVKEGQKVEVGFLTWKKSS